MAFIGDRIPDFWDELNGERLGEWLSALGYRKIEGVSVGMKLTMILHLKSFIFQLNHFNFKERDLK